MNEIEDFTDHTFCESDNASSEHEILIPTAKELTESKVENMFFSIPPAPSYVHQMDEGWWNIQFPGSGEEDTSHLDLDYKSIASMFFGMIALGALLLGIALFPWDDPHVDQKVNKVVDGVAGAIVNAVR